MRRAARVVGSSAGRRKPPCGEQPHPRKTNATGPLVLVGVLSLQNSAVIVPLAAGYAQQISFTSGYVPLDLIVLEAKQAWLELLRRAGADMP
jgi:hypothetical protein